jgi:mRNA interferase MazF
MRRGDIITVSLSGDYGKPRPAVVVQSDAYLHMESVTVLPLTSDVVDTATPCRVTVEASQGNGLRRRSQIMVDKASTVPRLRAGPVIGRLAGNDMTSVDQALAVFFGFA